MTSRAKKCSRPPDCFLCVAPAWWNGSRLVTVVVQGEDGVKQEKRTRPRGRCSLKECDAPDWTIYEADEYPHRTFQLAVIVSVVAAVALAGVKFTEVARRHACSRDSVRRFSRWVAELADPGHLAKVCARLDPDGIAHAEPATTRTTAAGHVLALLDRLADLFVVLGHELPATGPGIVRLLSDQLHRFQEVFHLTRPSPPLRVALPGFGG